MNASRALVLAFILLVASWLQAGVSSHIAVLNCRPDFILTTMICISILAGNVYGTVQSWWAGLLTAFLAGINYGSILLSRVLTGFLCGQLQAHIVQDNVFVPLTAAFAATWICELAYFLMAPDLHHLRWWTKMTMGESVYDALLAVPIYFGLRALNYGGDVNDGFRPFVETI